MYDIVLMAAEKTAHGNRGDWRGSFCKDIFQMADLVNDSPELKQVAISPLNLPEGFSESLNLPSIQRLYALNQISPVAEKVLGYEVTRGQHTEDAMRLTAGLLTRLSTDTPDLFAQLTANYKLNPEDAIQHCIEYMRLHDLATLAFQGAMHGKVKVGEDDYDEDRALLMAFEKNPTYQPVSDLLFDKETLTFYEKVGIHKDILHQIAYDSINGTTSLGKMLKKGKDCPPVDWLAYTARDFFELTRVFGIGDTMPFPKKIELVLNGLQEVSLALSDGSPFTLPEKLPETKTIDQLIPPNIVRTEEINSEPRFIYDGKTIAEQYVMHTILRLFFSGSPWVRGTHHLIHEKFKELYSDDKALLQRLLSTSEKELLESNLKDVLSEHSIKRWGYTASSQNMKPESFVFKDIGRTLVDYGGKVAPFEATFPGLMKCMGDVKNKPPVYLNH